MNTTIRDGIAVRTVFEYPPIPVRDHDWQAYFDALDYEPGCNEHYVGHGETEAEAIANLMDTIDDDDLIERLRDSLRVEQICTALKRGDLTADLMLRRLVKLAYEGGDLDALRLWGDLNLFAEREIEHV